MKRNHVPINALDLRVAKWIDAEGQPTAPLTLADFETRGTPWFIVLDPLGEVLHSDFHLDAERLIQAFGGGNEMQRAA